MEFKQATETFDEYQKIFVIDLVEKIKIKLIEAGMEGDQLIETTGNIAFSLTSAIDDMSMIERDGVSVRPFLGFRVSDDEVIHCGENSCTAEFITVAMDEVF